MNCSFPFHFGCFPVLVRGQIQENIQYRMIVLVKLRYGESKMERICFEIQEGEHFTKRKYSIRVVRECQSRLHWVQELKIKRRATKAAERKTRKSPRISYDRGNEVLRRSERLLLHM